ncbi:hypothetical protein Dimus_039076 [Dionaea muscipula]
MDNISTSRQEQLTIIEKGQTKGKEKAMPKGKENVDPVVQLLRKNVGVVIREARDFNPICIRTEQEKGKEKVQAKGKRHATSMTTENIDPMELNVSDISKAALAQRKRREREKLTKYAQHEQQKCERRQNSQRLRQERQKYGDSIKLRQRKPCRPTYTIENCEMNDDIEIARKHPSCMPSMSYAPPMNR